MKLETTRLIQAEPNVVWDNLVNVEVLKQCIPGCQTMEQTGENEYALTLKAKVGPVSATFTGELSLRDIVSGESYTLYFEGKGGAAGFSKGSAAVRLEPADGDTNLHYAVDAKIGGKIAQLGQRLVDGAARKMADDFFSRFEEIVAPAPAAEEGSAPTVQSEDEPAGGQKWLWIGGALVVIVILLWAAG
jgi:hypothetical protein